MRIALGLVAATLAAPLAVVLTFGAAYFLQVGWFAGRDPDLVFDSIQLYAALSAPVALFVTLAAGGPVAHQMSHRGHGSLTKCMLLGAFLGALPFLLFDAYIMGTNLLLYVSPAPNLENVLTAVRWAALGSWCGMWSAMAYWTIAIRGRSRP